MLLLGSKITTTLLSYMMLHTDESLYLNEIVRKFNFDKRNLVKKLNEFEKEKLLLKERRGNEFYYSLNKHFPLFDEYKKIILKTIGIESQLKTILTGFPGIKKAYIVGSYAKDKMDSFSDIDVLVVGNANTVELQKKIAVLQKNIKRDINLTNFSEKEYDKRIKDKEPFLRDVMSGKKVKLI